MLKIIEWIGYLICFGSVIANSLIRHNGDRDTIWFDVTLITMFAGLIIIVVAFLIRKYGRQNKENDRNF